MGAFLRVEFATALVLLGLVLLTVAARALAVRTRERRIGPLVAADTGDALLSLSAGEYRLAGRPDAVRRYPDGRQIPVELKRRRSPRYGPLRSHRVQVWAYCLLIEATTGRPPPFGVLRYSDGKEWTIPWDAPARSEILDLREEVDRPYDGRASPAPTKCARCRWRDGCTARAA